MSKEDFPPVKPGQAITSGRANREGAVLNRMARLSGGPGMSGIHTGTYVQIGTGPPWLQGIISITSVDDSDPANPIYTGKLRGFDFQTSQWGDRAKDWQIDANGLDTELSVGAKVAAYWDAHRGMFVPMQSSSLILVKLVLDGGVAGSPDPAGADCTFTYTVKFLSGDVLGSGIAPERARHPRAVYLEAGAGGRSEYAFAQLVEGVLILMCVEGEILSSSVCP